MLMAGLLSACDSEPGGGLSRPDQSPGGVPPGSVPPGGVPPVQEDQAETTAGENEAGNGAIDNRGSAAAADSSRWWTSLPRPAWSAFERQEAGNDWFEVYRIEDGIFAIYEPGQFEEVISYLILGEDRALLFDTGLGIGDIAAVVGRLTSLPVTVLNSHTHYDHVGGNHQFDSVISRDHPYARQRAQGLGNAQVGEFARGDWIWKTPPPGFDAERYSTRAWQVTSTIDEGAFIDLGGVSLEVVDAPGHSPDSLVLIDHQRRLMFTGDTFYLAPLYTHIPGGDFDAYAESAAKLADMSGGIDHLLMSHNTPKADSAFLLKMHDAFQSIRNGTPAFELNESGREYRFDGFSILTHDPPYAEEAKRQQ